MFKVKWSQNALQDLASTLTYLAENFTTKEITALQTEIKQIEGLLSDNPYIAKLIPERKEVRKLVVMKYNSLYYLVTNKEIIVLSFFSNRQHLDKRKLKSS
jgi:plasmid stabilization system protein ParE